MKNKLFPALVVFLTAAFLFAIVLPAYSKSPRQPNSDLAYANTVLKFKKALALSDDQVKRLQTMASDEQGELEPLVKQMLVDLKYLNDKLSIGSKDEELKPVLDTLKNNKQKIESIRNRYIDQSHDILTPTQQGKVILFTSLKTVNTVKSKKGKK